MHGATLATVEATAFAKQFAHHALQVSTLGQRVAVASVRGGEVVVLPKMGANPCRNSLLPGGQMQGAAHFGAAVGRFAVRADAALAGQLGSVFKGADTDHGPVKTGQCVCCFVHWTP